MISFVYITCRKNPILEWFVDSLYNQILEDNFDLKLIQIVIVDFELQYDNSRKEYIKNIINNRFDFIHVPPKPTPYQGLHRLTSQNYFCASNARNTGIIYSEHPYLVFVDDLSVLGDNSFKEIVKCAKEQIVVGFAYKKVYDLSVENGKIITKTECVSGTDHRINLSNSTFHQISGCQLYGYSASPKSVLFRVNGYDELCASMGGEDYNYGMRIEKLQIKIYYNKNVMFYESEGPQYKDNIFIRRDPKLSKELYTNLLRKYNVEKRYVECNVYDLSHFFLDLLTRQNYWYSEGNNYILEELCKKKKFQTNFDKDMKSIDGLYLKDL